MQTWDHYRLVLAIARQGGLRAAAQTLGLTHTTVSRRLAALEKTLGASVFDPSPTGYHPTALGQHLIHAAQEIEAIHRHTERQARAHPDAMQGPIKVSIPNAIVRALALEALSDFARAHREIELTIASSYALADLDRSEADVVIRVANTPDPHLVGRHLYNIHTAFYCARDYLDVTPLEDRCWITRTPDPQISRWIAASPYPEAPMGFSLDDLEVRHEAAARGMGMIMGACYLADRDPRLMRLPGSTPQPFADVWVLTHPDLRHLPRIKALTHALYHALKAHQNLAEGLII